MRTDVSLTGAKLQEFRWGYEERLVSGWDVVIEFWRW